MTKWREKQKARELRNVGESIREIARKLSVSSASVHSWCKDIRLTYLQEKRLKDRVFTALQKGRKKVAKQQKRKRLSEIKKYKRIGIKEVGGLSDREMLLVGAALYWAEGFKKDQRLGFANSDPAMVKFFINWLIKIGGVDKDEIRLRVGLNISHRYRVRKVEKYWSEITEIPLNQFQRPYFQNFKWKKEFRDPGKYFGVLRVRANKQRVLFRKIHGWVEGLRQALKKVYSQDERKRQAQQAYSRIISFRKREKLPERIDYKKLIEMGRRY
ncbi:hypothetical protein ACFLZP_02210 [Patescibacteria group bacterium]